MANKEYNCVNFGVGCKETLGSVDELHAHEENCAFIPLDCPYNCGIKVAKKNLTNHLLQLCDLRTIQCSLCNASFFHKDLSEHNDNCPEKSVNCEHCFKTYFRKELVEHIDICPEKLVPCAYHYLGCNTMRKNDDSEHEENINIHFSILCNSFKNLKDNQNTNQKDEINRAKIQISVLTNELKNLKETQIAMKRDISELKTVLLSCVQKDERSNKQNENLSRELQALVAKQEAGERNNKLDREKLENVLKTLAADNIYLKTSLASVKNQNELAMTAVNEYLTEKSQNNPTKQVAKVVPSAQAQATTATNTPGKSKYLPPSMRPTAKISSNQSEIGQASNQAKKPQIPVETIPQTKPSLTIDLRPKCEGLLPQRVDVKDMVKYITQQFYGSEEKIADTISCLISGVNLGTELDTPAILENKKVNGIKCQVGMDQVTRSIGGWNISLMLAPSGEIPANGWDICIHCIAKQHSLLYYSIKEGWINTNPRFSNGKIKGFGWFQITQETYNLLKLTHGPDLRSIFFVFKKNL